ncbi:MAG: hypothetical protein K8H89_14925 [Flavobacteriales bacterium]|nr:hypothetical protein [Flavobacteriales bacterium]
MKTAALAVLFNLGLFVPVTALAQDSAPLSGCDCPTVRLDDAYCASALVFEGVPISSDTVFSVGAQLRYPKNPIDHVSVLFRVNRSLKGQANTTTVISTSFKDDNCAFRFIMGQRYLVFAHKDGDLMLTDRCTPTRAMDTVGRSFSDSLEYVRSGHRWVDEMPIDKPCQ